MNFIEIENKHYILASSVLADQKTIVLKEGDTFALFEIHGDIYQLSAGSQGIYHNGTRYLSKMELTIDGLKPLLLSSLPREDNQMIIVDLTNPDLNLNNTNAILRGTIYISRSKFLWQGAYHEKITFTNFGLEPTSFKVELKYDADFADIFEVRGATRPRKGQRSPAMKLDDGVCFAYKGLDNITRETKVHLNPTPKFISGEVMRYEFNLNPKDEVAIEITAAFTEGYNEHEVLNFDASKNAMNTRMDKVRDYCAGILTSNEQFNEWINRSRNDLITMTTRTPHGLYPYAGIPWYSTAFGRDGIITAFECLWVEPELSKGVLKYLAQTQAKDFNDFQDAEPGKIFHETRGGEMAELGEIPFKLYYGTIDATPLFICLAGAYLERTNDLETLSLIWPNIEKALYWIDHYGDIDNDGFVEYKTKSSKGLTNQGWKDSYDSIFHEDGKLADEPIALCEVQGYVYDAKVNASAIARSLGFEDKAIELQQQADKLKEDFNEKFWSESKQIYVLALDGHKHPCNVISSNAGHCLFSGIATPERAHLTARNLLSENMFSGWGIRTIAESEARYNPMSYHDGSIWPHDNAIIAYGFSRYDLMDEVSKILSAAFDTAVHADDYRLPELFCGFDRIKGQGPTSYPVACVPQAWSVGAIFLILQACLGMKIKAAENTISFSHPVLPAFLKEITISNLRINDKQVILQIRKSKAGIDVTLLNQGTDVKIEVTNKGVMEVV
jgi:glycogen debranching enzyme